MSQITFKLVFSNIHEIKMCCWHLFQLDFWIPWAVMLIEQSDSRGGIL